MERRVTLKGWMSFVGVLALCGAAFAQPLAPKQPRTIDTLPSVIPIFPLEDATLFPKAANVFHIFEPRYRAMVADALKGDRIIGMVTLKPGFEADYEGRPAIHAIGCAGVIEDFEELPDGRFNILLRGLTRFRVVSEDQSRSYRLARVEAIADTLDDNEKDALHTQRQRLEQLVTKPGSASAIPPDISDEEVVNTLAIRLPVDPGERQGLLEVDRLLLRSQALVDLLAPPPTRR
jgi:Lon protease-like protein